MYTVIGQYQYLICDHCGERFYFHTQVSTNPTSDNKILSGLENGSKDMHDLCTRCAKQEEVDVCHGSCLKWHRKVALNAEGLCVYCEGDRMARHYTDRDLINGKGVGLALERTLRDYEQVRFLISEALVLRRPLIEIVNEQFPVKVGG